MDPIEQAAALLRSRSKVLVFTGAGISTESGIPDFRGPDGVWTKVDPAEFTIDRYLSSSETRSRSWRMRRDSGALRARPNDGHRAVTRLWESGRVHGVVTQNIDGLHQRAGLPDDAVIELHGNAHRTRCVACGYRTDTEEILTRIDEQGDPPCPECGGVLKVDVVLFGEMLPANATERAFELAREADAVVAVGSTLSVYPAAHVPLEVVRSGHPLVIVNRGETEFDEIATIRIDGGAGDSLTAIADALEMTR
ncbi:MAG TPA: Sir2 family NAD-dependent protein deacetylase [Acidimicrobiia bacterium]|nr:Sir2 family NAD-dependent protein deacetylase [Acidimicrobiia bacterium]